MVDVGSPFRDQGNAAFLWLRPPETKLARILGERGGGSVMREIRFRKD